MSTSASAAEQKQSENKDVQPAVKQTFTGYHSFMVNACKFTVDAVSYSPSITIVSSSLSIFHCFSSIILAAHTIYHENTGIVVIETVKSINTVDIIYIRL